MDKRETAQLLAMLQTHYPFAYKAFDNSMLEIAIQTWYQGLQDLDASLVFNVAQKIVMTDENEFPPKLAYIRKECLKALNPTAMISPETAFETARKKIISFGRYQKDKCKEALSPNIWRAIEAIGYDRWCNASDDDMGWIKKEFIAFYNDFDSPETEKKLLPPQILDRLQQLREIEEQKRLDDEDEQKKLGEG